MNKRRALVIVTLLLLAGSGLSQAPGSSAGLNELLARLPANSAAIRQDLLELEAADIRALCGMLTEPGPGEDAKARYALHGLAMVLGEPQQAEARGRFIEALAQALVATPAPRDPDFLLAQLQFAGDERVVPAVTALLANERHCGRAAHVLVAVGGEPALAALRQALAAAQGSCRVSIILALGELKDTGSVAVLLTDAAAADETLRAAALHALARSGAPEAKDVLLKAATSDAPAERGRAVACLLEYAARLAELQRADDATAICRELLKTPEPHVRSAALAALHAAAGPATDQDVLAAMSDADAQVRAAAVTIAARAPGSTLVVAGATAFDRASPDGRVALLQFFGRRRDPAALPTVYKALRDAEAPVRLAAIPVAAALGREQALRPLVDVLKTPQPEEVRAAKEALIALPAGDLTLGLIQLAHGAQPARAVLLDIIAARPSAQDTQMLLPFTRDADVNVRLASLRALGALAGEKDVTTLLGLVQESDDEELTEAGKALAAAVRRAADRERAVEPVIAALPNATPLHEAALLEVLGRIGGAAALKAVQTALARDDAEARAAALRAFGEWPDDEPAADVLAAARQAGDEREHALALRAYIRMIGLVKDRPAAEALKMCAAALEAARRPDEKKLVFAHLGQIEDPAALALLAPHVQDAALSAEAGAAVLQLADPLSTSAAPQLRTLLEQLARAGPEALRARAAEALAEIRKRAGFITDWWVAGPFEQPGADAAALHAAAFPPERRLEDAQWRKQPVGEGRRAAWLIDLNATMRGDNRAGYLFTRVYSPRAQAARLELGSDDSIKAWLNGALVDDNPAIRGAAPAQDVVETQLKEGWNTLLLKVVNGGGGWAACARFVSLAGEPLDGVYAQSGDRP